jgi:hypothetical protein
VASQKLEIPEVNAPLWRNSIVLQLIAPPPEFQTQSSQNAQDSLLWDFQFGQLFV